MSGIYQAFKKIIRCKLVVTAFRQMKYDD